MDNLTNHIKSLFEKYSENSFIYSYDHNQILNFEFYNNILKKTLIIQYDTQKKLYSLKSKNDRYSFDILITSDYLNDLQKYLDKTIEIKG